MSNFKENNINYFSDSDVTSVSQQNLLNEQLYLNLLNNSVPQCQTNANRSNFEQNILANSSLNNILSSVNGEISQQSMIMSNYPNNTSINSLRRRSTGCFTTSKILVPMQPLHESLSFSDSLNNLSNRYQMQQIQQQQQLFQEQWSPLQRTTRSASFSVPYSNEISPLNASKTRNRLISAGSIGSFSTNSSVQSSPSNIWEKVLHQNYLNNTSIRNNTRSLLSMMNNSANSSLSGLRSETDDQSKNLDEKIAIAISGNMFYKRDDWSILSHIPPHKQNTIHIRLEDEGPFGNDEIRCYVLSHFSSLCIRELKCVTCNDELKIYDRFPLINGTLFLSPIVYDKEKAISAGIPNKEQYIYGVCLKCLNGLNHIKCKWCNKEWDSDSLQIGTLYKYDIFAAFPCCEKRLSCNKCNKPLIDVNGLPYFSSYSELIECQHCKLREHHFIKPLDLIYTKAG